jgi:hypothetical protein
MSYTAPADRVVLESDPAESAKLLSCSRYLPFLLSDSAGSAVNRAAPIAGYMPDLPRVYASPALPGLIFAHRRRPPAGEEVLAYVAPEPMIRHGGYDFYDLWAYTMRPESTGYSRRNAISDDRHGSHYQIVIKSTDRLTIFAGQPDPLDPARFSFDFELNGVKRSVSGSVANDRRVYLQLGGTAAALNLRLVTDSRDTTSPDK